MALFLILSYILLFIWEGKINVFSRPKNGLLTKKQNDSKAIHDGWRIYMNELNRHLHALNLRIGFVTIITIIIMYSFSIISVQNYMFNGYQKCNRLKNECIQFGIRSRSFFYISVVIDMPWNQLLVVSIDSMTFPKIVQTF